MPNVKDEHKWIKSCESGKDSHVFLLEIWEKGREINGDEGLRQMETL
jgi:hypothetical protein